jgi:hypothetical protein
VRPLASAAQDTKEILGPQRCIPETIEGRERAVGATWVEPIQLENSERAVRCLLRRLGAPGGLAVCYEADLRYAAEEFGRYWGGPLASRTADV